MIRPASDRRADLDWLRVSAFGLLILYHAGMAWSGWSWHLTSSDSIDWLREGMRFLNRWRMPLIFVVSGRPSCWRWATRSPAAFARDRVRRLLVPLAFGMVVLVPPQVYLERLYRGQFHGSFLDWLPQAFAGVYPAGNMSWHHLWFLAYVLVLTFVLLPYFLWARSDAGRAAHARVARVVARTGLQWLMPLPLAAAMLVADADLAQHQRPDRRLVRARLLRRAAALRRLPVRLAGVAGRAQPPALPVARHRRRGLRRPLCLLRRWRRCVR